MRVGACCVGVAVVSSSGTFVDIVASDSISFESGFACACESSVGVGTRGFGVTVGLSSFAFVDILASVTVSFEVLESFESRSAFAVE